MKELEMLKGKVIKAISTNEDTHAFKVHTDKGVFEFYIKARATGGKEIPMWLEEIDADVVDSIVGKTISNCSIEREENEEERSTSFNVIFDFEDGFEHDKYGFTFTLDTWSPVITLNWEFVGVRAV